MNVKSLCASVLSIVTVGLAIYFSSHTDQKPIRSSVYTERHMERAVEPSDITESP